MTFWESKYIKEINIIVRDNVVNMGKTLNKLTEENRQEWIAKLKEETARLLNVQNLRIECLKQCQMLQIDVASYESEKLTLLEERELLEKLLKEYKNTVLDRQNRFKTIIAMHTELCVFLEKDYKTYSESYVPTVTDLESLSSQIQQLESEKNEFLKQFEDAKQNIVQILTKSKSEDKSDIAKLVLEEDFMLAVNKKNLETLLDYQKTLQEKQNL